MCSLSQSCNILIILSVKMLYCAPSQLSLRSITFISYFFASQHPICVPCLSSFHSFFFFFLGNYIHFSFLFIGFSLLFLRSYICHFPLLLSLLYTYATYGFSSLKFLTRKEEKSNEFLSQANFQFGDNQTSTILEIQSILK